jgi:hypothetical protein
MKHVGTTDGTGPLPWKRLLLAGLYIELALMLVTVPIYASLTDPLPTMYTVTPPATLVAAVIFGAWAARNAVRPLLVGFAAGLTALLIYGVLVLLAYAASPETFDPAAALHPSYLASHALKVLGGTVGGYWVAYSRARHA